MNVKRVLAIVLSLAVLIAFAAEGSAAEMKKVPKVDNFIIFVDHSGSMAMGYNGGAKKIVLAKDMLSKMNAGIPELSYQSSFYTFAPFASYSEPAPYSKAAIDGAIGSLDTSYEIFHRKTPMGDGLIDLDSVLAGMSGKTAVIVVTDGANNIGADPVAQAQAMYAKYGGNVCFHVISYADSAHGQRVVDEIRALNNCSVPAEGLALMDDATMAQFIEDVFFETVMVEDAAPTYVYNINFAFDSYELAPDAIRSLEDALQVIQQYPGKSVLLEGWTDSIGTDEYNAGLSQNRANSVKAWLVEHGVDDARLTAVGKGESIKYDNTTAEGRRLNRRCEISFTD